ncbi:MAG: hypothetical protein ACOCW6_09440 [Spirochaetota bacterium]
MKQNLLYHLIVGVLTGFGLSLLFYISFGMFDAAGFVVWSVVTGVLGGLAGGLWLKSIGATVGLTMFLRVIVFAALSGLFVL